MIKYFRKLLLIVIVPVGFIVVSSTVISFLIAVISYKIDKVDFNTAFISILGVIAILMTVVSVVGLIMFFVTRED